MNYFQSVDFNAGIIYSSMEKMIGKIRHSTDFLGSAGEKIRLPKIQVLPKNISTNVELEILDATSTAALKHFAAVYGGMFTIEMWHYPDPYHKQYITFEYSISCVKGVKEMTVAEIEKILGHKVKIVGEKVN